MNRFFLSREAMRDLDEIRAYLKEIPAKPAREIGQAIQAMLNTIARDPYMGTRHSRLALLFGTEIRSRLTAPYRIFYRLGGSAPEIMAILHTARDIPAIMARRIQ